jgi:arylsulfatase A-like enzyme
MGSSADNWKTLTYHGPNSGEHVSYQAIRTDRYKFIRYRSLSGMDELYDLKRDPHELNNLLPNKAPAKLQDDLRRRLDRMVKGSDVRTEAP